MKNILLILFALWASRVTFALPRTDPIDERDAEVVTRLVEKIQKQRDFTALDELARLPPQVGTRTLGIYALDRSTDSERADRAVLALRTVPGLGEYFRKRLETLLAQGGEISALSDFELLALIANSEAAFAAAPFLFNESPGFQGSDYSISPVKWLAAQALTKMNLPDAPTRKRFAALNEEDLKKWRTWAIENKLVASGPTPANQAPIDPGPIQRENANGQANAGNDGASNEPPRKAFTGARVILFSVGTVILAVVFLYLFRQARTASK